MSTGNSRIFCSVDACFIPGSHARDCLERPGLHECPGCMPGLAMEGGEFDGSLICYHHHRQAVNALDRLPGLDDALRVALAPYRSPQAPKQPGSRSSESPDAIASNVTAARQRLALQLAGMVAVVAAERNFHHPANTVEDYCAFLKRSAPWLSRHRHYAPVWGEKMRALAADAQRNAHPGKRPGVAMGPCPVTVARDGEAVACGQSVRYEPPPDERSDEERAADRTPTVPYYPTCTACGTSEPVSWWIARMNAADPPTNMTAPALAAWLSLELHRDITAAAVRQWAFRGRIEAVDRSPDRRPLYNRTLAEEYARSPRVYNQPKTGASA